MKPSTYINDYILNEDRYNWLAVALAALLFINYILFLNASFGTTPSPIFLNIDQAYFKSIIHSLEIKWQLFPASLENKSAAAPPYHHLDSQIKWLLTHILSTNNSIFIINLCIFILFGVGIWRLKIPPKFSIFLLLFAILSLKFPTFSDAKEMIANPLHFKLKSDIFGNSNTLFGFATLTLLWKCPRPIRMLIYLFSFYIKSPAVPSFFLLEAYQTFVKDPPHKSNQKTKVLWMLFVITCFLISSQLFFYRIHDFIEGYALASSKSLLQYHVNSKIRWLIDGALLYDTLILLLLARSWTGDSSQKKIAVFFFFIILFFLVYDTIGIVQINIPNFFQIISYIKYLLLLIILKMNLSNRIVFWGSKPLTIILSILILLNMYIALHFSGALLWKEYNRMTEFLDNRELIEITRPIKSNFEMIAINFVNSPIRTNKDRRLCGIVKNPIWVSSLSVYPIAKDSVTRDWNRLLNALTGKESFPAEIVWLILDRSKTNYDRQYIDPIFYMVKQTETHSLFRRRG